MAYGLITDSSPARWSDPTHEVNRVTDAKTVFHISDSMNQFFRGSQKGRLSELVSVNNPTVIRLFTYI